tara:strand:+ start:7806 stop:8261 length:456 start_codon:yes stop_codon:yes gene_type:complete
VAGERIKGESHAAYEAFQIFRDTDPKSRTIDAVCGYEVDGKKRQRSVLGRWHKRHDWAGRAAQWDIERSRDALRAFILRRNGDLEKFIDDDFTIMKAAQQIVIKKTLKLSKQEDPNATEFRTTMLGYQVVREGLKDLIGIFNQEVENAARS